jgi:hypothetical protein
MDERRVRSNPAESELINTPARSLLDEPGLSPNTDSLRLEVAWVLGATRVLQLKGSQGAKDATEAERMDRQRLLRLDASLKDFCKGRKTASSIASWVAIDDEFHSAIAKATGSPRLSADIDRYRLLHRVFNRTHTDATVLKQAAEEHQDILDALKRRDPEDARKAMRHHLEEWQRFFANHLR